MQLTELVLELNKILQPNNIKDFCPNGLQIEGRSEVKKIVTGVTASQALIDAAIAQQADAILVHHGYFWKGEAYPITGMKKNRIAALLKHDISLLAYHLPIDVHPTLGNNAQLARLFEIENTTMLDNDGIVMKGELKTPLTATQFAQKITVTLSREPLVSAVRNDEIKTIAWCSGGGQGYIDLAANDGIDAYLTGEASEQTIHSSRELGIDFFAAGHHATERYGVKAVGEHLAHEFDLDVMFIDIDNPV